TITVSDVTDASKASGLSTPVPLRVVALNVNVAAPTDAQPGTPFGFQVYITDANGVQKTDYTGSVAFGSSDDAADVPDYYTFTAGDAGAHAFTATFHAGGPQFLAATDLDNLGTPGVSNPVWVTAPTAGFEVQTTAQQVAGASFTYHVTTKDAYGRTPTA